MPEKTILASIFLNIIGVLGLLLSPLVVGHLVDGYNLSLSYAGYFVTAQMFGIVLSSVMMFTRGERLNKRKLRAFGLILGAVGYFMIAQFKHRYGLWGMSLIIGFGGGILACANFVLLSSSSNASKNFGILMFLMSSFGAISLVGLSQITALYGSEALFLTLALIYTLALPLVFLIHPNVQQASDSLQKTSKQKVDERNSALPWLCLSIFFFTYAAIGAFWTYAERIGVTSGLSTEQVSMVLGIGIILALLGCVVAYNVSQRLGYKHPLMAAFFILALLFTLLSFPISPTIYIGCILVFYFHWNMTDIFELGLLSSLSNDSRFAALAPAFQAIGNVIGPAVGASLLGLGLDLSYVMYFSSVSICTALILLVYLASQMK